MASKPTWAAEERSWDCGRTSTKQVGLLEKGFQGLVVFLPAFKRGDQVFEIANNRGLL